MQSIDDINFQQLWQNARKSRSWSSKSSGDWNKKATSFAARNKTSPFIDLVIDKLPLTKDHTVLDIGCGPGTLALPIAERVAGVTALDYSATMLSTLSGFADERKLTNIQTVEAAWEDDWQNAGINPHDITLASRSLNVEFLQAALQKADHYAKKYVFLIERISPTYFEPAVFEAIGRPFDSGPDYIYTVNILYQLGIHANVEILQLNKATRYSSLDDILDSFRWMLKELSDQEDRLLQNYIQNHATFHSDGTLSLERNHPLTWALIWWKK